MKFSEYYILTEQKSMLKEMPHLGSPDGDFDVGLELLKGDKSALTDKLIRIFSGEPVKSAHNEMVLQLDTPEEQEEFKKELFNSIVFIPYIKKYFNMSEDELIDIIDNAMHGMAMAEEDLNELKAKNIPKYLFNKDFRDKHKDATVVPDETDAYRSQMLGLAHKHQDVGQRIRDTGEIPLDDYYTSKEYREKMRTILADVLGNENLYNKVMADPDKRSKLSKIYKHFKKGIQGGLSGVLNAIGIKQPAWLQTESALVEDNKIFGITPESIEEKIKEVIKTLAEEAIDRKEETLPHKYPEEAEKQSERLLKNGDIVGWLVHKSAERMLLFDYKSIEEGIKRASVYLARMVESLLEQNVNIKQIIDYMSALSKDHVLDFIEKSYDKKEPEWVVFYMAVLQQMEETEKVAPSAHTFPSEEEEEII